MKAVVLMCLLHAALGAFPWNPPGSHATEPTPEAGSECITDDDSCGCCVMWREMNRLKTYFNTTLNTLEEEYLQTKRILDITEVNRAAFSAALSNDMSCFGPFSNDVLIIYQHVFINLGDGYNEDTGIFTAPHSGVYSLALTVYSDAGAAGSTLAACAGLQVNGQLVAGPREQNKHDQEDSASTVVALHLKAGDQVAVSLPIGCFLCDDSSHYNTFSAFLLYPTEYA